MLIEKDVPIPSKKSKYNFDSMLGSGASKEIYAIRPNPGYTKLILASGSVFSIKCTNSLVFL